MRFNNGMFGACICVLALLGTAIGGFVLNVHEDQREVTKYNFIADVSGLFSYSDAPEYIEYNPSSNYVGYTPIGAIEYTQSPTANNYRYVVQNGATSSASLTLTNSSDYPGDYGNFQFGQSDYGYVQAPDVRFLWNGSIDFGSTTTVYGKESNAIVRSIGTPIENSHIHITKLSNVLTAFAVNLTSYASLDIGITYNSTYPVLFYAGSWDVNQVSAYDGFFNSYHTTMNESNAMPTRLTVEVASNMVSAYRGDSVIWTATADNVGVLAWYNNKADGYTTPGVSCSVTLTATLTENPVYGYMQPTAGVKATTTGATWQNGYENSVIDLKVTKNGDNPGGEGWFGLTVGNLDIEIEYWNGFHVGYGSDDVPGSYNSVALGQWLAIQIRIDGLNGTVTFTPTNNANLMQTVEPTDYSVVVNDLLTPGTINTLYISSTIQSLKFQVTDTKVFLNTYNTVMIDPSIEITDYFPNYSDYRLNFYSFALLGSSMSINGQNCPINKDNGTITFTNVAGFEFTKKLENLYITFNEGRTNLTFVNDGTTYDLGETTTTTISFVGWWYFTTGLYEITEGIENYWNWDLNGFQATGGECLLIFLTIIGAGIIVYSVYGKGKIQLFDWLVIIFAVFIGSALLGF